jgi:hypothetical protein
MCDASCLVNGVDNELSLLGCYSKYSKMDKGAKDKLAGSPEENGGE